MKTRKGLITDNAFNAILAISGTLLFIYTMNTVINEKTEPQTIKASTYTDREIFIDLKTLEAKTSYEKSTEHVLRVEFLGIEGDNNWVEIIGDVPETFQERLDTAKAIAVLKGIVTEKELPIFSTADIQDIENKRIVKLKK